MQQTMTMMPPSSPVHTSSAVSSSSSPPPPPPLSVAATAAANRKMVVPFSLPTDSEWLTPNLCRLREQIEAFAVTPQDIAERRAGLKPALGSVGLRCRRCAHLTSGKARGAVVYPASVAQVHQAVRNFYRHHFYACPEIPESVKEQMRSFNSNNKKQSKRRASQYWVRSCREMLGMIDVNGEEEGAAMEKKKGKDKARQPHIRFRDGWVYSGTTCNSSTNTGVGPGGTISGTTAQVAPAQIASEASHAPGQDIGVATSSLKPPAAAADCSDGSRQRASSAESDMSLSADDDDGIDGIDINGAMDDLPEEKVSLEADQVDLWDKRSEHRHCSSLRASMLSVASVSADTPHNGLGEHDVNLLHDIFGSDTEEDPEHNLQKSQGTQRTTESSQMTECSQITGERTDLQFDASDLLSVQVSVLQMNSSGSSQPPPPPRAAAAAAAAAAPAAPAPPAFAPSTSVPSSFFDNMPSTPMSTSQNQILGYVRLVSYLSTQLHFCHNAGISIASLHLPPPSSSISLASVVDAIARASSEARTRNDRTSENVLSGDCIRNDLHLLGRALYWKFTGKDPIHMIVDIGRPFTESGASVAQPLLSAHEDARRSCKRERTNRQSQNPTCTSLLQDLGVPVSMCTLIENLLLVDNDHSSQRYHDAEELREDLLYMIAQPRVYLFDTDSSGSTGQLVFPCGKLYGRDEETTTLLACFDRVIVSRQSRSAIFVSGYSGSGKTLLIEQLRAPLAASSGHIISGKFDQLGQVQPISVIFAAFNKYCKDILESEAGVLKQIRADILNGLGNHANVLSDLIPNLRPLIGDYTSAPSAIKGVEALNRLIYHFRALVRSIASPSHPAILFMDDLQWADSAALEMLSTLVSDDTMSSVLFVGTYRTDEVGPAHPLHNFRQAMESAGISILDIQLDDLSNANINSMISDTLRLLPRLTSSLSDAVHSKTGGNPMFAVQFVRSLHDEGMLKFSAASKQWEWDVDTINSKEVADNVALLMAAKMRRLDEKMQWILMVASCFGSRFDASLIALLDAEGDEIGRIILLELAVSEGLLCRIPKSNEYKFSHDQIQQAAYSLIPVQEISALRLDIGRKLWTRSTAEELDNILFVVVDQLSRGSELIIDRDEKIRFAWLCLNAGEKAMSSSAFNPALMYLLQGSVMLEEIDWETNYELSLRTFSACAEAQYVVGNHEMAMISLSRIFAHGKCFGDQLDAYCILLNSLFSQGKLKEAVAKGLDLISQLGEEIPSDPTQAVIKAEFQKVHTMLSETSAAKILAMDEMVNANKLAAMKICYFLNQYTFRVDQGLLSMIASRMIQMSLKHGLCKEVALAFASLASFSSAFGRYEEARGFGRLSSALLERFGDERYYPLVHLVLNSFVYIYVEPLQSVLPRLKEGQEKSMSAGDAISSWSNANMYILNSFEFGTRLDDLVNEIKTFAQQMKKNYLHNMTRPPLQAALNLMGESDDPTTLSGSAMNQDDLLKLAQETSFFNVVKTIVFFRLWLAYVFGKYELAAEMAKQLREISKTRPVRSGTHVSESFYTGLIAIIMAHRNEPGEWRSLVAESIEKFRGLVSASEWNFLHKLRLLEAETAYYLYGDIDGASTAYRDAIRLAGEHGYISDRALACERAGIFYTETCGLPAALDHFQNAQKYYLDWGAAKKASDLQERYLNQHGNG